jgi:hypothetical protein
MAIDVLLYIGNARELIKNTVLRGFGYQAGGASSIPVLFAN